MNQSIFIQVVVAVLLFSTLGATVSFDNFWYIQVSAYLGIAFGVCMAAAMLKSLIALRKGVSFPFALNSTDLLVLIWAVYYLVIFIISTKFNHLPRSALIMLFLFSTYSLIRSALNRKTVIQIFYILFFVGSFEAIYGVFQLMGILPNIFQFKLGGSFGNPGDLANLLTLTWTISLGLFFYTTKKWLKLIFLAFTLIQIGIIVSSGARTAWIACSCSSVALIWYFNFRYITFRFLFEKINRHKLYFSFIFPVVLLFCIALAVMLYSFKATSADGRVFMYRLSTDLVLEKPLFGHGYDSFFTMQHQKQIEYFQHNPNDSKNGLLASEVVFAFNDYLQLAIEFGCVLLVLLFILLWRIFSFKEIQEDQPEHSNPLLFIGRTALGSILICMLFSYPLQNPTISLCFFILLAIISNFDSKVLLKITFRKNQLTLLTLLPLLFSCLIFFYSFQSIIYGLRWKQAYALLTKNPKECLFQYKRINRFLKHDISFVHNYGSVLFLAKEYSQCGRYYEKNRYLCLTTYIFLISAQSYEEIKDFGKAEECYKKASYLVPHLFKPKFKLFQLYQKMGNYKSARIIAEEIRNMRIKVFSDDVKNIKTEVNKYLSSESTLGN